MPCEEPLPVPSAHHTRLDRPSPIPLVIQLRLSIQPVPKTAPPPGSLLLDRAGVGALPCIFLGGLHVRRLVNINAASHPFELVPEDDLSVGDAVIEEINHVIVRLEGSNVPLEGVLKLVHVQ